MATSGQFTLDEIAGRLRPAGFDKSDILRSIPARFRDQAARHPTQVAIRDAERTVTYAELDRLSDTVASGIERLCGADDCRVAIVFPLCSDAIAAQMGVFKAGKTSVALDPDFPAARSAALLCDADARLIICDRSSLQTCRSLYGRATVCTLDELTRPASPQRPPDSIDCESAAAIIYTSGSTGIPKGIVHSHRTLLHRCWSDSNYLQISPLDHISLLTPLSFGAGLPQMLAALLNGATLYPFDLRRREFSDLYDWLWTERISIFYPPVSAFRQFLESCPANERYEDCRYVIQSGEATLARTAEAWRRHFPRDCTLLTQLAITEAQVVCRFAISHQTKFKERYAPIGYADCDKQLLIVNAEGQPVAPGEIGELVVISPYLASGYWSAVDHAPEAFGGENVFESETGSIGFRTRDLVSHDNRGRLRHHGRSDSTIKLHGYRIDFSEIEAALLDHDNIAAAVCVAREREDHRQQLVAFYVPVDVENPPDSDGLRRWLRSCIPDYMVPARLLPVAELPHTINGKIARCAVASLELVQRSRGADLHTFENELQRRFVEIWRSVIGHDDIGIDDDIQDIGGDALSMVQLSAAVSRCIGRQTSVKDLVECRTIRRLADFLDRADDPITCVTLLPGVPARPVRRPLFCIGGFFRYRSVAEALGARWLTLGVNLQSETLLLRTCSANGRATGQPAGSWPPRVEQLAAAYIEEIRKHQRAGPWQLLGSAFGGVIAFEMARQLMAAGENVSVLALLDCMAPRAQLPMTLGGWFSRAGEWAMNSIPVPQPDPRADRATREADRRRAEEVAIGILGQCVVVSTERALSCARSFDCAQSRLVRSGGRSAQYP